MKPHLLPLFPTTLYRETIETSCITVQYGRIGSGDPEAKSERSRKDHLSHSSLHRGHLSHTLHPQSRQHCRRPQTPLTHTPTPTLLPSGKKYRSLWTSVSFSKASDTHTHTHKQSFIHFFVWHHCIPSSKS